LCKVYGYCRVALASEEEAEKRIGLIKKYCEDNSLNLEKCFCDNGVSGFDTGEDFKHLMRKLKSGDMVVIINLSQLSRSNARLLALMSQFEDMGVKIIYTDGDQVDTSSITKWLDARWAK
jgi:DNA invertase Pin-like site-specific DNA recombinase